MTENKIRRLRGRPRKPLLEDYDRYPIAMAIAFRDALGVSERKSFDLVIALFMSEEFNQDKRSDEKELLNRVSYRIVSTPGAPATVAGAASTLRQKANTAKRAPEEAAWLAVMALASTIALTASDYDQGAARIRELSASVEEMAYCEATLIPMLWAKFHKPIFPRPSS